MPLLDLRQQNEEERRIPDFRVSTAFTMLAIIGAVSLATWAFQKGGEGSIIRTLLVLPLLPGGVAGRYFSGHGGNMIVAYSTAIGVNSVLYITVWFLASSTWKRMRKD